MISQFFIRFRAIALMIMPVAFNRGFEFDKGRQLFSLGDFTHAQGQRGLRTGEKMFTFADVKRGKFQLTGRIQNANLRQIESTPGSADN